MQLAAPLRDPGNSGSAAPSQLRPPSTTGPFCCCGSTTWCCSQCSRCGSSPPSCALRRSPPTSRSRWVLQGPSALAPWPPTRPPTAPEARPLAQGHPLGPRGTLAAWVPKRDCRFSPPHPEDVPARRRRCHRLWPSRWAAPTTRPASGCSGQVRSRRRRWRCCRATSGRTMTHSTPCSRTTDSGERHTCKLAARTLATRQGPCLRSRV